MGAALGSSRRHFGSAHGHADSLKFKICATELPLGSFLKDVSNENMVCRGYCTVGPPPPPALLPLGREDQEG